MRWNYLALANKKSLAGNPPESSTPKSGSWGGWYIQAISAYAPSRGGAPVMEYLYSDEGQQAWMKGYCVPAPGRPALAQRRLGGPARADASGGHRRERRDPLIGPTRRWP